MEETTVVIVGAGPAGLATAACLNYLGIPNVVLEREDCYASLWKKRAYDRLKLHLAKEFCKLPYMPFPSKAPTYIPKNDFVAYLDNYVDHFKINLHYTRNVESAFYDENRGGWSVSVHNTSLEVKEEYVAQFLVVATGENSEGVIPEVPGLDGFEGEYLHSSRYLNGEQYLGKNVLVVGSGNSGMEIAYDLSNWGAKTSIVIRSPIHVLNLQTVRIGMFLSKYISLKAVDRLSALLGKLSYGDLSKFGIERPKKGPFYLKIKKGKAPTIDVGCVHKIKDGKIKVFPAIRNIEGSRIEFENDKDDEFDAIIFATGYRSTVRRWLDDGGSLFGENGMPKQSLSKPWKGENGLYCVGFSRNGLLGISRDAKNTAEDIGACLGLTKRNN